MKIFLLESKFLRVNLIPLVATDAIHSPVAGLVGYPEGSPIKGLNSERGNASIPTD